MKTIKADFRKTGWIEIPATTQTVVVNFKNGTKTVMQLVDFICINKRTKNNIDSIVLYEEGEEIKED